MLFIYCCFHDCYYHYFIVFYIESIKREPLSIRLLSRLPASKTSQQFLILYGFPHTMSRFFLYNLFFFFSFYFVKEQEEVDAKTIHAFIQQVEKDASGKQITPWGQYVCVHTWVCIYNISSGCLTDSTILWQFNNTVTFTDREL